MRELQNLEGQKFGLWTVLERTMIKSSTYPCYVCRCLCGGYNIISSNELKWGKSRRCRKCYLASTDLSGQTFGRLTILSATDERSNRNVVYLAQCTCGTIKKINGRSIKRGDAISCGCYNREAKRAQCGPAHPNYIDGRTPQNERLRKTLEYKMWRMQVFQRDNYTCQKCKIKGGKLHPHHIANFSSHIELQTDSHNGITLCESCHKEFHKKYGYGNNDIWQLLEFMPYCNM